MSRAARVHRWAAANLAVLLLAGMVSPAGAAPATFGPAASNADPAPEGRSGSTPSTGDGPPAAVIASGDGRPRDRAGGGSDPTIGSGAVARGGPDRRTYVPGVVLVAFRPGTPASAKVSAHRSVRASTATALSPLARDTERVVLPHGASVDRAIAVLRRNPNVRFAEPDHVVSTDATSDDPLITDGTLWGMESATSAHANPYGSGASDAWAAGLTGSRSVVVGVVDEGIQFDHPDLAPNVWTNPWEIAGNGIDDDGNGYADDIHGWDFRNGDASVYDSPSADAHGTHVAGTIGGVGGNGVGVAGVNWAVTMISAKFLEGSGETSDAVAALDYLTDLKIRHGLNIVATNNSWGGSEDDQALVDAINRGGDAGILFIAAAGNNGSDIDSAPAYPASSTCATRFDTGTPRGWDCIVSVASINSAGGRSGFSNFGSVSVDLGAPGENVASSYPPGSYGALSGTSMATPHVTGAIALLASCNAGLDGQALRGDLLDAATATASLAGVTVTGGRLNVASMMASCDASGPPSALLISPAAFVIGTSFPIRVWFNRSVTGLSTADFTIGGTSAGWAASALTGSGLGPYTLTVSTATAVDGVVLVSLKADSVSDGTTTGPAAATAAPRVSIDRAAPSLATPSIAPSSVARNRGFRVSTSATDSTSIASASVRIDGGPWHGIGPTDGAFGDTTEQVASFLGGSVVQVSNATDSTCALLSDGRVRCWGANGWGQLGSGTSAASSTAPIEIVGLANVVSISSGYAHTCAVIAGGSVRCWGFNLDGQLGDGSTYPWAVATPVSVIGISNAIAVSAGLYFTCALLADGTIRCWGENHGELGDGTLADRRTPVQVVGIDDAVAIGAGSNSACALIADGTVECWGTGVFGELGDGQGDGHPRPRPVTGISSAVSLGVSVGGHHVCAVLADGTARCWGSNDYGQLGDGSTTDARVPVGVLGITNAVAIAPGYDFTCALLADGAVHCWGANLWGQLGNGSGGGSPSPVPVSGLGDAAALSANGAHGCVVTAAAGVRCWGLNYSGQQGDGLNVDRTTPGPVTGLTGPLAVGVHSVCVRATDGPGNASAGTTCVQVTIVADTTAPNAAIGVPANPTNADTVWFAVGFGEPVGGVTAGDLARTGSATGCAIGQPLSTGTPGGYRVALSGCSAGTVAISLAAGAGSDAAGNPGPPGVVASTSVTIDRTAPAVGTPGLVPNSTWPGAPVSVTASLADASGVADAAVNVDGGGWIPAAAGDGTFGGATESADAIVNVASNALAVATGGTFSCALLGDGTVRCWGENGLRQLGDGTTTGRLTPVAVVGVEDAIAITAGANHACALRSTGAVTCWGGNDSGQVGSGYVDLYASSDPHAVIGLDDAVAIAAGGRHTCALVAGGGVRCWGNNNFGQMGDGTQMNRFTPGDVTGITGAVSLASGFEHACAVLADGTGRCWGSGLLGDGVDFWSRQWSTVPVVVSGLTGATSLAAGNGSTCALVGGGSVRCWGRSESGQLGNGGTTYSTTPVTTAGISGATELGGGAYHYCVVLPAGTVRCWGRNETGQLGDGTLTNRPTSVLVAGLTGVSGVDGGSLVIDLGFPVFHSCARLIDGTISCWGYNGTGDLGDGTTTDRASPGHVVGIEAVLSVGDHAVCVRAVDRAGNASGGGACTTLTLAPDTQPPVATIVAAANPTKAPSVVFAVGFDEPVSGLEAADFSLSGSAAGCVAGGPVALSTSAYRVTLTGCGEGTVALHLALASVADLADNPGPTVETASPAVTIDRTPASAVLTGPATPTAAASLTYALAFSEPVIGLSAADFNRTGSAAGCTVQAPSGSGAAFTVMVTGCGTGSVGLALKAGSVLDAATNASPLVPAAAASVVVDRSLPASGVPSVAARLKAATNGTSVPYRLAWSATDTGSGIVRHEVARSVNGGAYAILTSTLTTTAFNVGLSSGASYRFRVRAVDAAGNVGAWAYSATVRPSLIQDASSSIRYSGSWSRAVSTSFSGGSARSAKTAGASATLTFSGRGIAFVSTLATTRGRVRIYLDGAYAGLVDLRSTSTVYHAVAYQRTWTSSGAHTIRVVVEGTAGRPRVDLDAFVVLR